MSKQYIITERAHFMCPNMHFGILISIDKNYLFNSVKETLQALFDAHPFLKSVIARESSGRLYYKFQEQTEAKFTEKISTGSLQGDYKEVSEMGWDVFHEGLLKVFVYPKPDGFDILFIAHHLLCDGRGLLELARSFADSYVKGVSPVYREVCLIKSLKDFSIGSDLPWISKMIIDRVNRKWKKENHSVEYNKYQKFEVNYIKQNTVRLSIETKEGADVRSIIDLCHEKEISINDYLIAKMMIDEHTNKVLIAADIRKYVTVYKERSLGNFSTAFGVVCNSKEKDIWSLAKKVSKIVENQMNSPKKLMLVLACYIRMCPELIDAVAISTLGDYPSNAGKFVGSNMFGYKNRNGYSITNLGKIESDTIEKAIFIPPASPANKKTLGVVTVNTTMSVCSIETVGNIEYEKS